MSNKPQPTRVEYRVKRVERFIVTRYEVGENDTGCVSERGEYDNDDIAYEVGYALAKAESEQLGWGPFDDRMQYPIHPRSENAVRVE